MNKIFIIIQREYLTRVRQKSFLITTLLAPLGFFLLIASSVLISTFSQGSTHVAIIYESGLFKDIPIPDADDQTVYFHKVAEGYEALETELKKQKKDDAKYEALIFIPANFNPNNPNNPAIAYRYIKRPGLVKQQFINQRITDAVFALRIKGKTGVEDMEELQQKVKLNYESLDNSKEKQGYTDAAALVGMVMGFAIYISLFFYGTMIMKGVMEEKTNRIVEVLTSSVRPFQLLMGKIIGVGAVGLTQFVLWIILMFGVNILSGIIFGITMGSGSNTMSNMKSSGIDPDDILIITQNISALPITQIVILFPLYFMGGFFLYGSLFAAVGAAIGEDGDQQSLMIPITIPIIISIFIAINVINNPDSALGLWGSLIPFTSPIVMCALLPFRPEWWQITLSILFLIAGFVLTTYVAAKIYRTGILMYGKKIKMKEIARWIFSKE
jgi:ABC-2 type transport system permease protein